MNQIRSLCIAIAILAVLRIRHWSENLPLSGNLKNENIIVTILQAGFFSE